jgi:hypothetical protein
MWRLTLMLSAVILPTAVAAQQPRLSSDQRDFCSFSARELDRQLREYVRRADTSRPGAPTESDRQPAASNLAAANQLIAVRKGIPCP